MKIIANLNYKPIALRVIVVLQLVSQYNDVFL